MEKVTDTVKAFSRTHGGGGGVSRKWIEWGSEGAKIIENPPQADFFEKNKKREEKIIEKVLKRGEKLSETMLETHLITKKKPAALVNRSDLWCFFLDCDGQPRKLFRCCQIRKIMFGLSEVVIWSQLSCGYLYR